MTCYVSIIFHIFTRQMLSNLGTLIERVTKCKNKDKVKPQKNIKHYLKICSQVDKDRG